MIGALPETLTVGDKDYPIPTDYRNILQVFEMLSSTELYDYEKIIVSTYLIFESFSCADDIYEAIENGFDINEAQEKIKWFISEGLPDGVNLEIPVYSWPQDEQMIFSAVNKVAGEETRQMDYLHWWTFMGYFREIGETTFSFITGIRNKLNHGKKLEKHEKEFLAKNKNLVKLEKPKTKEEQEQEDKYQALLDEVLG